MANAQPDAATSARIGEVEVVRVGGQSDTSIGVVLLGPGSDLEKSGPGGGADDTVLDFRATVPSVTAREGHGGDRYIYMIFVGESCRISPGISNLVLGEGGR